MRLQNLTKWHRVFENCATHIRDDRTVTTRTTGTDVNVGRINKPMVENRPVTIQYLTNVLNLSFGPPRTVLHLRYTDIAQFLHAGYQHTWRKITKFDVLISLFHIFSSSQKKEATDEGRNMGSSYQLLNRKNWRAKETPKFHDRQSIPSVFVL
jgi:hypothetical protein